MGNLSIYKSEAGEREIQRRYREALDTWPVPAEHVRVPTREGETFVVVSGPTDAPPLLLLHGSGTNTAMWQGDVAAWARHFRVHALDLIGEPAVEPLRRAASSGDEDFRRLVEDLIERIGQGPR